jgi:4-nitrophenyl phosphatase
MDGVLYRGSQPLPGVADMFAAIERRGASYMLATNNSMASPAEYSARLARLGIVVPEERIQTAGTATRDYLRQHFEAGSPIYVVGMPPLADQIYNIGGFTPVEPVEHIANTAAVVVGLDQLFTYEKLKLASFAIRAGAAFVATNADASLPTETGFLPGAGSIVAAIATASGATPTVIGKPSPEVLIQSAYDLGITPDRAVMIGDRLDTDILAGNRAGMLTVLVETGVNKAADVATSEAKPDLIVDDLVALRELLEAV